MGGVKYIEIRIIDGATVGKLKQQITSAKYPGLELSMKSMLVTINREYAADESVLPECAEVAMFPPVSGG